MPTPFCIVFCIKVKKLLLQAGLAVFPSTGLPKASERPGIFKVRINDARELITATYGAPLVDVMNRRRFLCSKGPEDPERQVQLGRFQTLAGWAPDSAGACAVCLSFPEKRG